MTPITITFIFCFFIFRTPLANDLDTSIVDKICITNSLRSNLDGTYHFKNFNSALNGPVYYNSENKKYLYPYIDDEYKYLIQSYSSISSGACSASCVIDNPPSGYIFDPHDCFKGWRTYDYTNDVWREDQNMRLLVNCQAPADSTSPFPMYTIIIGWISVVFVLILIIARQQQSVFTEEKRMLKISVFVLVFNSVLFIMALVAEDASCCWRDNQVLSAFVTSVPWTHMVVVYLMELVWCCNSKGFRNSESMSFTVGLILFILFVYLTVICVACLIAGEAYIGVMMTVYLAWNLFMLGDMVCYNTHLSDKRSQETTNVLHQPFLHYNTNVVQVPMVQQNIFINNIRHSVSLH
eukprot:224151_1